MPQAFLWRFQLSGHASDLLSPRQWVMPWSAIGRKGFSAQPLEAHLVRKSVNAEIVVKASRDVLRYSVEELAGLLEEVARLATAR